MNDTLQDPLRRRLMLAAGMLPLLTASRPGLAASYLPDFFAIPKALWVWQSYTPITVWPEVVDYARAAGFNEIYWGGMHSTTVHDYLMATASGTSKKNWQRLRHALGEIKLFAACGDPSYISKPGVPTTVATLFQLKQETAGLFSGLHLDVEIHTLDAWDRESKRPEMARAYIDMLAAIRKQVRSGKLGLKIGAALHPTYCFVPLPGEPDKRMYSSCLPYIDQVMMMAYRDTPQGTMDWLDKTEPGEQSMLAQTLLSGKDFRAGITTKAGLPNGVSYAGSSANLFQNSMIDLHSRLLGRGSGAYRGISCNAYDNRIV